MTEKLVEACLEIDTGEWAHASVRTERQDYTPTGLGLRFIRRTELRKIVPLADTTIYEMERRGEFPRRFLLTSRCVAWDFGEVEVWMRERRRASRDGLLRLAAMPDVRQRKTRPVTRLAARSENVGFERDLSKRGVNSLFGSLSKSNP